MKRLVIDGYTFVGSHHPEVLHNIFDRDPVEIVCLATRQDGRKNLMLFRRRQNEDSMCRRLFEGLEEGVEGSL